MNEMSKKSNQGQVIESKITEEKAEKLWKFWERNGNTSAFAAICLAFVLLCIGIFQIFDTGILIGKAAKNAYQKTYSEVSEAKQQEYYQQAYNNAENTHHVSNKITISIGDIQKKSPILLKMMLWRTRPQKAFGAVLQTFFKEILYHGSKFLERVYSRST